MKKIKDKMKNKRRQIGKKNKKEKRMVKRKKHILNKNILGNRSRWKEKEYKESYKIELSGNFNFFNNMENVLIKFDKIDSLFKKNKKKFFFINIYDVEDFDHTSILILISKIKKYNIKVAKGNLPKNTEPREILINSGYLEYFNTKITSTNNHSGMHTSRYNVNPTIAGGIIQKTTKQIWGESKENKKMYTMIIELMQNTNNHASGKKTVGEKWWFHYHYIEEQDVVEYIFLDNGVGILDSLGKNEDYAFNEKVKWLLYKGQDKVLKKLINGDLKKVSDRTSTGKRNRGKGLPTTKEAVDGNFIEDLKIISNYSFGDVSSDNYTLLKTNFSGTLFKWRISKKTRKGGIIQ